MKVASNQFRKEKKTKMNPQSSLSGLLAHCDWTCSWFKLVILSQKGSDKRDGTPILGEVCMYGLREKEAFS